MADQSDVSNALAAAVDGVRNGAAWTIERGWPLPAKQQTFLAQNGILVTVNPRPGFNRLTTRYPVEAHELPAVPVTLTVTMTGNTATFAGTCSTDQIAGVQVGATAWAVRCQPVSDDPEQQIGTTSSSTPATIASALAALSGGTASGATLTLAGLVAARTGRDVGTLTPTRNQQSGFCVCVWTADPVTRDQVASAIDQALSNVPFLVLADQSVGRLFWAGDTSFDRAETANLFRRELYYTVDYATTIYQAAPAILFPGAIINSVTDAGAIAGSNIPS